MHNLKLKVLGACFLSFILLATPAKSDCYNYCSVCGLSAWGGPTIDTSSLKELATKAGVDIKNIKESYDRLTNTIREQLATSPLAQVKDVVVEKMDVDFKEKDSKELFTNPDEEIYKTQEYTKNSDESVGSRVIANAKTYELEKKGDYANEISATKRREFIRQQSTISALARMLVLKNEFTNIKKGIDALTKKNEGMIDKKSSEAELLKQNLKLTLTWYKLLIFQKQVEAARLEYESQMALSNMRMVKNTLTLSEK